MCLPVSTRGPQRGERLKPRRRPSSPAVQLNQVSARSRQPVAPEDGLHARVNANGCPICLLISPGEVDDAARAAALLRGLENAALVIADKGLCADSIRVHA
jgi:hypothetical protein